jgi:hypothetical protein
MKYKEFFLFLLESSDSEYNAAVDFHERRDVQLRDIIDEFLKNNGVGSIKWKTVSANLITNVWYQFGKYNRIDINKLDKISDSILTNISRLDASTALAGHSTYAVKDELRDDYDLTDKQWGGFIMVC